MAGREQLISVLARLWAAIRKRRRLSATALAAFVLLVVPIWPFFPSCDVKPPSFRYEYLYVRMSDEYRHLVKYGFDVLGVYYWDIGGVILIRVLPFLDGSRLFNQFNAIRNAERKSAWYLVSKDYDGRMIGGKIYHIPAHLKALIEASPGELDYERCDVMRVIVTGKPPAPNEEN